MDNQNIKINFPDKMEVESKDIASIRETAKHISNWLHNDLRNIVAPLQVLPRIPDMLGEFQKKMVEQFSELFKNQIETLVVARQANIKVLEKKISLIKDYILKKENQLKEAKDKIIERYNGLRGKLVKQHERYLNNLDDHAYNIVEKIYPEEILDKFSYVSAPTQNYIIAHTQEAAIVRQSLIKSQLNKTKAAVNSFLEKREEFYDNLSTILTDIEAGSYSLPFYYVEVEEIDTKQKRVDIYFPFDLANGDNKIDSKEIIALRSAAMKFNPNSTVTKKEDVEEITNFIIENMDVPKAEVKRFIEDLKASNFDGEVLDA